jgi:hypothetical protein
VISAFSCSIKYFTAKYFTLLVVDVLEMVGLWFLVSFMFDLRVPFHHNEVTGRIVTCISDL